MRSQLSCPKAGRRCANKHSIFFRGDLVGIYEKLSIDGAAASFVERVESDLYDEFSRIADTVNQNQAKVLHAFSSNAVTAGHMAPSSGYGYADVGREMLERVFASAFDAEDALVRAQIVSGTHAISIALQGLLKSGQRLLYATGAPYDTLWEVIGIKPSENSLIERGVKYSAIDLQGDGDIDLSALERALDTLHDIAVVGFQRSAGYAWRRALSLERLQEAAALVRAKRPDCLLFVDNCYGEFASTAEPVSMGADIAVGSLIKNPGGGFAPTGGYLCGTKTAVARVESALTAPGIGRECGSYEATYRPFYQGLFIAPVVVGEALKTATLFSAAFSALGYRVLPAPGQPRHDIITAIEFRRREALLAFCRAIQATSPIDSLAVPEPWPMPGYTHEVVMAAGTFVQGSSIELSADAPLCEPYIGYVQGALSYAHGRLACMKAVQAMREIDQ
jgi:cystathionine beta-lyase family protein involved in aluminum resistance